MFKVPKIKVIGVGGAGCYLIDKAIERGISTAEYFVVDDDYGRLHISKCDNKIQLIGSTHTGADYDYSPKTAIANKSLIVNAIKGADMIVLIAGMGGGMGSAVPSIIAEVAKDSNIVVVAIVCTPFLFEGKKRLDNTQRGIKDLKQKANMTLVNVPLRWMMDNVFVRTDPAGNVKMDKEKSTERIDGAVALVMALDRSIRNQGPSDSVYNDRGIIIL